MKLTPVIAALRARCPYFENRVAGAAQFKNLPEVGKLRLPAAYVVPGDDSPGENKSQTDYWQELKEGFSVVVILSNGRDERGQFASYDVVDDVRQMLFKALLGWNPEECGNPINYDGGTLLDLNRHELIYQFDFSIISELTNGDNVTTIASSIQDAINAVPALPFTASSSAGVVTLTARHKGLCGNEIPVSLNYYGFGGGEVLPAGVQIAVATGTAGTGSPVLTGAVAAMADEPFDYIGLPFNDTASVNTLVTEMNDTSGRWSYARQLYGHVYTAKIGTLSELVTAGDQFNQQHITLAGYEKETQTPADELAASRTARAAVFIRNDPARPTQTGELVGMLPAPKGKRFTMTEQQTLLSHGVATAYVESGVLRIQRDVTTYRKNAYGVADNSYLDSETLHTSAYVLRKLKSVITSKYGRHKLASDGTRFGPGQAIVTPAVIKGELLATYRQLERAGIVENYELFKQYLVVERDASDPNRLNTLFPPDYVNQLRVFAVVNQFRLQYSEESA